MCLICNETKAVFKEYNLRRHFETAHQQQYATMDREQRLQKVMELKKGRQQQQNMFHRAKSLTDGAVKASFIIAEEIAKSGKSFAEGDFLKKRYA